MASPLTRTLRHAAGVAGIIAILGALLPATTVLGDGPQTFTVDSTADTLGNCAVPTECTLRQAIEDANSTFDADTILFSIGTGIQTIVLTEELPGIYYPLTIDGTSQPGYDADNPTPMIELDGENVDGRGLQVWTNDSEIRGLILNRFTSEAIGLHGDGNLLEGSYVGLDKTGTSIYPLRRSWPAGIIVKGSNNVIGGATADMRNVISGNTHGIEFDSDNAQANTVVGNYIGTDRTGTVLLGNLNRGISINRGTDDVIGGTAAGEGNVVASLPTEDGAILVGGSGHTIIGNFLGVNVDGTAFADPISPDYYQSNGIVVAGGNITIGGTAAGAGNVIAGFGLSGVSVAFFAVGLTDHNEIVGNYIGVDATGITAYGNRYGGVVVQSANNLVANNVIAANGVDGQAGGVFISDPDALGNVVRGNRIGIAADGSALGNVGPGVLVSNQSHANLIGGTAPLDGNDIANNTGPGVLVSGAGGPCCAYGTSILGNSIFANGTDDSPALGISPGAPNDAGDLDIGPNGLQNYPVLGALTPNGSMTTVSGTLNSTPSRTLRVELFRSDSCDSSGYGEGQVFLGSVDASTDVNGDSTFTTDVAQVIDDSAGFVTATATDLTTNETSGFSHCNIWPTSTLTELVPAGGTLSTGTTTATDTIATSVTTPVEGTVSITEGPATTTTPSGFSLLGVQVDITAPAGDTSNPLEVTFLLDPSLTVGLGPDDIHVFRTEAATTTEVPNCLVTSPIDPDPCVEVRGYDGDTGAISLTVLTSHASAWNFGSVGFIAPPTGTPVVMGPQAMEGDLKVAMGSTLKVGYDFMIAKRHVAQTVSFVGAHVDFTYTCVAGPSTPKKVKPAGSGTLSVPIPNAAILDAANSPAWLPSAKQGDASVYQGSLVLATDLCTDNGLVRFRDGGTFFVSIDSDGNGEKITMRWHYSAAGSAGNWSVALGVVPN